MSTDRDFYQKQAEEVISETEKTAHKLSKEYRDSLRNTIARGFEKTDNDAESVMLERFREISSENAIALEKSIERSSKLQEEQRKYLQFTSSLSIAILSIPVPLVLETTNIVKSLAVFGTGAVGLLVTAILSAWAGWRDMRLSIKENEAKLILDGVVEDHNRQSAQKLFNLSVLNKQKRIKITHPIENPYDTEQFHDFKKKSNRFYLNNNKLGWIQILFFLSIIIIGSSFFLEI